MRTLVLILASSSVLLAQKLDPREIIGRSIAATERSWKARQNYTYLERDEERHAQRTRDVEARQHREPGEPPADRADRGAP